MKRVIILGIDALDRELINKYIDKLPNFKEIIDESYEIESISTFPPDSDTAWASIYTGLNPANHGVVDFVDPLERNKIKYKNSTYVDINSIKYKTFWDILSANNIRSCIVFPHLVTKFWPVNGTMIISDPETDEILVQPDSIKSFISAKKIIGQKRIPKSKLELKKYIANKRNVVIEEFEIAKKAFEKTDWELFFFYSSTLDSIMHIFWNYCDSDDPTYPGKNPFESTIMDFHILYDKLIGEFKNSLNEDDHFIVMSDHGHYRRPTNLFNINEVLRRNNYLFEKEGKLKDIYTFNEKIKRGLVNIAQRSGLRPLAQTVLRIFPFIKKYYTNPSNIDFQKTVAHCTDLSGMKAYSYGGIIVHRDKFGNESEYEEVINEIKEILNSYKIPQTETKVVDWVKRREELYQGKYIDKYPALIFNLKDGYGAGWATNVPLFTESLAHKFYPGSHRATTPVFFMKKTDKIIKKSKIELMDIAPTILDIFGKNIEKYDFDGNSIFN